MLVCIVRPHERIIMFLGEAKYAYVKVFVFKIYQIYAGIGRAERAQLGKALKRVIECFGLRKPKPWFGEKISARSPLHILEQSLTFW